MKDRVSVNPGRVKLTNEVTGASQYYRLEMADSPREQGTPLNKNTFLNDSTETILYGSAGDHTVSDAIGELGSRRVRPATNTIYTCYPDTSHPYIEMSAMHLCTGVTKNYYFVFKSGTVTRYSRTDNTSQSVNISGEFSDGYEYDEIRSHLFGDVIQIIYRKIANSYYYYQSVLLNLATMNTLPAADSASSYYNHMLIGENSTYAFVASFTYNSEVNEDYVTLYRYPLSGAAASHSSSLWTLEGWTARSGFGTATKTYFIENGSGSRTILIMDGPNKTLKRSSEIAGLPSSSLYVIKPLWCETSGANVTAVYCIVSTSASANYQLYKFTDLDGTTPAASKILNLDTSAIPYYGGHITANRVLLYCSGANWIKVFDMSTNTFVYSVTSAVNIDAKIGYTEIQQRSKRAMPTNSPIIPAGDKGALITSGSSYARKYYYNPTSKWASWESLTFYSVDANTMIAAASASKKAILTGSNLTDIRYSPGYFKEGRL